MTHNFKGSNNRAKLKQLNETLRIELNNEHLIKQLMCEAETLFFNKTPLSAGDEVLCSFISSDS